MVCIVEDIDEEIESGCSPQILQQAFEEFQRHQLNSASPLTGRSQNTGERRVTTVEEQQTQEDLEDDEALLRSSLSLQMRRALNFTSQ